jgi:hypothetical protein
MYDCFGGVVHSILSLPSVHSLLQDERFTHVITRLHVLILQTARILLKWVISYLTTSYCIRVTLKSKQQQQQQQQQQPAPKEERRKED